jgi:UDP-2-acetamido-3-amino-2,3-dideoxy-glucuronate N-acetyltransferase
MDFKIHPSSDVQTSQIGDGTTIWQFCVVLKDAVIGKNCNINFNVFIENDVVIGDNVTVKSGVQLWDGIRIGSDVFIGPNATFVNNPYVRSKQYPGKHIGASILQGASIGANATIMGSIIIGEYAFIGAGSVVTKNIPPYQLWYGNPAAHKGFITKEGEIIGINLQSKFGDKRFNYINEKLIAI